MAENQSGVYGVVHFGPSMSILNLTCLSMEWHNNIYGSLGSVHVVTDQGLIPVSSESDYSDCYLHVFPRGVTVSLL